MDPFATLCSWGLNVSRETFEKLQGHVALLEKWQKSLNLVAPSTMPQVWERHVLDSAQLACYWPEGAQSLWDLGSGAGFPGLTLCALLKVPTTLVESDQKKVAFLREVIRQEKLPATVLCERIERLAPQEAAVVTARALTPLKNLLSFQRALAPQSVGLYLKGAQVQEEINEATQAHAFIYEKFPSQTHCEGTVLRVKLS